MTIIDLAKRLNNLGINVFPIKPFDAQKKAETEAAGKEYKECKTPLSGLDLDHYYKNKTTEAEIEIWFAKTNNNLGVVTGAISRVDVFEIDGRESLEHFIKVLVEKTPAIAKKLEPTYRVKTGSGGMHVYFRFSLDEFPKGIPILNLFKGVGHSEISIRGDGHYVVGAESTHPSGKQYEGIGEPEIIVELTKTELDEIIKAFDKDEKIEAAKKTPPLKDYLAPEFRIKKGERHNILLSVAAKMAFAYRTPLKRGVMTTEQFVDLFWDYIKTHCDEPYSKNNDDEKKEVEDIALTGIKKFVAKEKDEEDGDNENLIQKLLDVVNEEITAKFKNEVGTAYVEVKINGHSEVIKQESEDFRLFVFKTLREKGAFFTEKKIMDLILMSIRAETNFLEGHQKLNLRVAKDGEAFYYHLADYKRRGVKITKDGFSLVEQVPPIFVMGSGSAQIEPSWNKELHADPLNEFLEMFHVETEDRQLAKCVLVSYFVPEIPHLIHNLCGVAGAGKTTFQRKIKALVDPAPTDVLFLTKKIEDNLQQVLGHYLVVYDNVNQELTDELSNFICTSTTGGSHEKRKLYTDDDVMKYSFRRCFALNGINRAAIQPDIMDRSWVHELELFEDESRKTEEFINTWFDELRPHLLGQVFEAVSKAMALHETVKVVMSRMSDFTRWGESISQALGFEPNVFMNNYLAMITEKDDEAITDSAEGRALLSLISERDETPVIFNGTTAELFLTLTRLAIAEGVKTDDWRQWANTQKKLTRKIKSLAPNLKKSRKVTIKFKQITAGEKKGHKGILIEHVGKLENTAIDVKPANPGLDAFSTE